MPNCKLVQLGLERNKIGESNINHHRICFMELNICCESDSKLEKSKIAESVKIAARMVLSRGEFCLFFGDFELTFFGARMVKIGARTVVTA